MKKIKEISVRPNNSLSSLFIQISKCRGKQETRSSILQDALDIALKGKNINWRDVESETVRNIAPPEKLAANWKLPVPTEDYDEIKERIEEVYDTNKVTNPFVIRLLLIYYKNFCENKEWRYETDEESDYNDEVLENKSNMKYDYLENIKEKMFNNNGNPIVYDMKYEFSNTESADIMVNSPNNIKRFEEYKKIAKSSEIACDCCELSTYTYKAMYGFLGGYKVENYTENKYKLKNDTSIYYGNTIIPFRNILKHFQENESNFISSRLYELSDKVERLARNYHCIGNMIPAPFSLSSLNNSVETRYTFWDLDITQIKKYYDNRNYELDEVLNLYLKDLFNNFDGYSEEMIKNCIQWLENFKGWEDFVERNYLSELIEVKNANGKLPKDTEKFSNYLTTLNSFIEKRNETILTLLKNKLENNKEGKTGQNIGVFVSPDGVTRCTMKNWTGIIYKIPRTSLELCRDNKHLKQSGIYFLLSRSEDTNEDEIYVGKAYAGINDGSVFNHLRTHKEDENESYWTEAVVLVTSNDYLSYEGVSYLEKRFSDMINRAKRYRVKNAPNTSNINLLDEDKSDMEEIIERLKFVLDMFRYSMFEVLDEVVTEKEVQIKTKDKNTTLYLASTRDNSLDRSFNAKGRRTRSGFVVHMGSEVAPLPTNSCSVATKRLRKKYIKAINKDNVLTENIHLNSPSAAASFVAFSSKNGNKEWKNENGLSLGEIERRE